MEQSPVNDLDNAAPKSTLGVMFRGACRGWLKLPGISGGTIAFVTGIYAELVGTLARFGPASIVQLAQPKAFCSKITWVFCSALVSVWVWASLCWRWWGAISIGKQRHCCGRSFSV